MKQDKPQYDDLLFKLLSVKDPTSGKDREIIIYSANHTETKSIDMLGKVDNNTTIMFNIVDITASIENNEAVFDQYRINDLQKFRDTTKAFELTTETSLIVQSIIAVLFEDLELLHKKIQIITSATNALRFVANNRKTFNSEGNIILAQGDESLANIVFKTVDGEAVNPSGEDSLKIAQAVRSVVLAHLDIDTEDKQEVDALQREIEKKILESLPDYLAAGDMEVNMPAILDHIDMIQFSQSEVEDSQSNDDIEEDDDNFGEEKE